MNEAILALVGEAASAQVAPTKRNLLQAEVRVENRFDVYFTPKLSEMKDYEVENNQGCQITTTFVDLDGNKKVATLQISTLVKGAESVSGAKNLALIKSKIGKTFQATVSLGKKDTNKGILFIAPNTEVKVFNLKSAAAKIKVAEEDDE